jgi:hypothetical protein
LAAALEVLAAVWDRGIAAASPMMATRPSIMWSEARSRICLGERLCRRLDNLSERQRKQVLGVAVEMRDHLSASKPSGIA